MNSSGNKNIVLKNFSLLVRVRIINIIVLVFAMYISAIYLFGEHHNILGNFKSIKLHGIILSSVFSTMAGYIINYFYDQDKDSLYRPITNKFHHFLKQREALKIYLIFNIFSLVIAICLSFRIFIFFVIYQFLIWFYSHKLSRIVFMNNIISSVLMIFPFLALFLFYENYSQYILFLSLFLFLLVLIRDICKDISSYKFDDLFNYHTLPNMVGIITTKLILNILLLFLGGVSFYLSQIPHLYEIRLYYLLTAFLSLFVALALWGISRNKIYILIIMIKFWIFIGTISLLFIDGNPLELFFQ